MTRNEKIIYIINLGATLEEVYLSSEFTDWSENDLDHEINYLERLSDDF